MRTPDRLGQGLLGLPFLWLGYEAAAEPGPRVQMAAALGVPEPATAVRVNGVAMAVGGAALVFDVLPRAAALGLAVSMVPTTIAGHPFWRDEDPVARKVNRIQVLKNAGLVGGLLTLALRRRR